MLLKLFKCNIGIGDSLTDSFLLYECTFFCWTEVHLRYAIGAVIVLFFYSSMAITFRPMSDSIMDYANIKALPIYLHLKGILQMGLVVLSFHLKTDYEQVYAVVHFIVIMVWTIVVFLIEPYNYSRLNMWQRVILVGVSFHQLLIVIHVYLKPNSWVFVVLQLLIIAVSVLIGVYLQVKHCPSLLYKTQGRDYKKLLKFAFTNKISVKELTGHRLDYVIRDD